MTAIEPGHDLFELNLNALRYRFPHYADQIGSSFQSTLESSASIDDISSFINIGAGRLRAAIVLGLRALSTVYIRAAGDPQSAFILFEPQWDAIRRAFFVRDCRETILSPQVFWILGEEWRKDFASLIRSQGLFHFPPSHFLFCPAAPQENPLLTIQEVQSLLKETILREQACFSEAKRVYLQEGKKPSSALPRIWAHVESSASIYRNITRSILDAFSDLGCEVYCSEFRRGWGSSEKTMTELIRFAPDLCLFLSGPSSCVFESLGIASAIHQHIPARRLTWFLDHPHYFPQSFIRLHECARDEAAVCDRSFLSCFSSCAPRSLFHLPVAASIRRRGQYKEEFAFPIVYVGSIIHTDIYLQPLSAKARKLLESLLSLKKSQPASIFAPPINGQANASAWNELTQCACAFNAERMKKQFPSPQLSLDYFLYVLATHRARLAAVKALLPLGLHLFGPDDWIPLLGDEYKHRLHGLIDSERLPDCYASARINLNLHSLQCPTCLNARDFDVPRAKGFLLTDWVEDMEKGFLRDGVHCSVFKDAEDLLEKAEYYLAHDDERRQLAETGCEWVEARHMLDNRAREWLKILYPGTMDSGKQGE
ncbi:MAG: glycosyltransferase [Candidatus Omnitrophota bacterium]